MKTRKKMFVTDLDGTLFTDEKIIHAKDLAALESLGREGVIRVFATGKSLYSFQKAVRQMGFSSICGDMPVDYVIFSTGAGIMECTHGEIIKKESLGASDVRRISGYFDSLGLDYMVHRPVPDTRYFIYRIGDSPRNGQESSWNADPAERVKNPDFYARIALYREFARPMTQGDGVDFGESTEILAIVPPRSGHEIADRVQKALGEFSVIRATSPLDGKSMWIEVFHPLVSKSQSVAWLAARLGMTRKHVVSVGNDYNDLDLLEWSGRGFVVANAPADIQKHFEVVASNNRCGVAEVIYNKMTAHYV